MARNVNVERIKNKKARQTEDQIRKKVTEFLRQQGIKGKAVFGYDQPVDEDQLRRELISLSLKTKGERMAPYYPEKCKSSFLGNFYK